MTATVHQLWRNLQGVLPQSDLCVRIETKNDTTGLGVGVVAMRAQTGNKQVSTREQNDTVKKDCRKNTHKWNLEAPKALMTVSKIPTGGERKKVVRI